MNLAASVLNGSGVQLDDCIFPDLELWFVEAEGHEAFFTGEPICFSSATPQSG